MSYDFPVELVNFEGLVKLKDIKTVGFAYLVGHHELFKARIYKDILVTASQIENIDWKPNPLPSRNRPGCRQAATLPDSR